ncbi:hypothetical protein J4G33_00050 [Actinotalea sp. BY-33]|uniref:Uncharacterized protein n=1 Tax=Actinotalea soli TaxID=2819234 RepID=A0A939RU35_9CELL|nr:hypothetical protein [Actinotalea soli]
MPDGPGLLALLRSGATAAAATWATRQAAAAVLGGADPRWTRTNHRGEPVSLLAGPAATVGLAAGLLVGGGGRAAAAGTVAALGAGAFGVVDDVTEDTARRRKGLRGHLGALAHGEVTTGGLKVLGIGATSLVAAALAPREPAGRSRLATGVEVLGSGVLIAACANLVNLLDLRPGRALKATALAAGPALASGAGAPAAAACLGVVVAGWRDDLAERDMLGDGGANALGAALGTAVVLGAPRPVRCWVLAGVLALTVASERVSFTQVIARTPVLRELDAWGRRPAPAVDGPPG